MRPELGSLVLDLAWVAVLAAALYVVLRGAKWALDLAPMQKERRDLVNRATPIVGALAALVFALFAARAVFEDHPNALPLAMALVVAAFVAASWNALRDFLSGVIIKGGRICSEGDNVRIGDVAGRVESMGLRVLTLRTPHGDEAVIPYGSIARGAVLRTPVMEAVVPHVFRMRVPSGISVVDLRALVRDSAIRCHWSSIVREPEIQTAGEGELEVTVFALDADRGATVEAVVRAAAQPLLAESGESTRPGPSRGATLPS